MRLEAPAAARPAAACARPAAACAGPRPPPAASASLAPSAAEFRTSRTLCMRTLKGARRGLGLRRRDDRAAGCTTATSRRPLGTGESRGGVRVGVRCSAAREGLDGAGSPGARPRAVWIGLLLLLAWVAWGNNLGAAGLVDDTEPLFAEAARQMVETGDWTTPQFNAQPRFDKPALVYWLIAASLRLFGQHVWAARLPSAAAALLFTAALFATVRRFGLVRDPTAAAVATNGEEEGVVEGSPTNEASATAAALVFSLSPLVVVWGSTALSDMLLCTTMGGTLLAWFHAYARGARWGYPAAAVLCGLAVLTKGPVGLALPGAAVVLFLAYTGELWAVVTREIPFLSAGATFLATSVPWYVAMARRHGAMYLGTFFGYHNWERYTKGVNHHGDRPPWYASAMVLGGYLPWSLALPAALAGALGAGPRAWAGRLRAWRALPRGRRLTLLAAAYLVSTVGVFAGSSSQLPSYYLPVAPAVAVLAAGVLAPGAGVGGWAAGATAAALLAAMGALGGAMWWLPGSLAADADLNTAAIGRALLAGGIHVRGALVWALAAAAAVAWAWRASASAPARRAGDAEGLSEHAGGRAEEGTGGGGGGGVVVGGGGGGGAALPRVAAAAAAGMAAFLLLAFTPAYRIVDRTRQLPLRRLAAAAAAAQRPGEPIMMAGTRMPSVVWYARRPVAFFDTAREALHVARTEAATGTPSALLLSERGLLGRAGEGGGGGGLQWLDEGGEHVLVRVPLPGGGGNAAGVGGKRAKGRRR